jgi:hypothetical protein
MIMPDNQDDEKQEPLKQKDKRLSTFLLDKLQVSWSYEVGIAGVLSMILAYLFATYARGGPLSSDITLYMNVGLNNIRMPFILNRYFHIFLQKLFLELAPHPLEGYHYFWGFIIGLNVFLMYLSARRILKTSNLFNGVLAVSLFFSIQVLAIISGIVYVDFMAMTMIMAMVFVYILSLDKQHANPWIIGLLGLLFFLSLKTKETTLPAAVLFLGLGWVRGHKFNLAVFVKNLFWVFCGVLAGILLFVILNGVLLGDPFFGLRIADWREFFQTYISPSADMIWQGNFDDWYQGFWFTFLAIPFTLYIISGVVINQKAHFTRKVIWAVPLLFIAFLILTINIRFGYLPRFGLPILPLICVLAAQVVEIKWPDDVKGRKSILVYSGIGLILSAGIRLFMRFLAPILGWDLETIVNLYLHPLLLTLLLASFFFIKNHLMRNIVNLVIILSFLISPLIINLRIMFVVRSNEKSFTQLVTPFTEFEEEISYFPEMHFYAIKSVFPAGPIDIVKDINEFLVLFNIYFDASATQENITFVLAPHDVSADILVEVFDYVLIPIENWDDIQSRTQTFAEVTELYDVHFSSDSRLVLLTSQD